MTQYPVMTKQNYRGKPGIKYIKTYGTTRIYAQDMSALANFPWLQSRVARNATITVW